MFGAGRRGVGEGSLLVSASPWVRRGTLRYSLVYLPNKSLRGHLIDMDNGTGDTLLPVRLVCASFVCSLCMGLCAAVCTVCPYACLPGSVYMFVCVCFYAYVYEFVCIYVYMCIYVCICVYICIYVYICVYIY